MLDSLDVTDLIAATIKAREAIANNFEKTLAKAIKDAAENGFFEITVSVPKPLLAGKFLFPLFERLKDKGFKVHCPYDIGSYCSYATISWRVK